MRGFMFRDFAQAVLLYGVVVVAGLAMAEPAWPQTALAGHAEGGAPDMPCADIGEIRAHLEKRYSETLLAVGFVNEKIAINVYTSEAGTFTVVLVTAKGTACIQHVGEGFSVRSKPVAGETGS